MSKKEEEEAAGTGKTTCATLQWDDAVLAAADLVLLPDDLGRGFNGVVKRVYHKPTSTELALKYAHTNDYGTDESAVYASFSSTCTNLLQPVRLPGSNSNSNSNSNVNVNLPRHMLLLPLCAPLSQARLRLRDVGAQMVQALQHVHAAGWLHRDLKPSNMVVEPRERKTVFLIDFGLSEPWRDADTGMHVPFQEDQPRVGSLLFASAAASGGFTQSRRDDLESLGYVLIYLATRGADLPWAAAAREGAGQHGSSEARVRVYTSKLQCSVEELCDDSANVMRELPGLGDYMRAVRSLQFRDKPPYSRLIKTLMRAS